MTASTATSRGAAQLSTATAVAHLTVSAAGLLYHLRRPVHFFNVGHLRQQPWAPPEQLRDEMLAKGSVVVMCMRIG
jgi:hypothetical protein